MTDEINKVVESSTEEETTGAVDWDAMASQVDSVDEEEGSAETAPVEQESKETEKAKEDKGKPLGEQEAKPTEEEVKPKEGEEEQQPDKQATDEQIKEAEKQYIDQLEKLYAFDEATATQLSTEPEKVLPKLAAKLHVDVYKTVYAQLAQMVPEMIRNVSAMDARENSAKEKFFGAWPELKQYEKQVIEAGMMFRKLNPNANADEAVQAIGKLVVDSLGLKIERGQQQQSQEEKPQPFSPAGTGKTSVASATKGVWEELAMDEDDS